MKRPTNNAGTSGQVGPKSKNSKYRQHSEQARPSERLRREGEAPHNEGSPKPPTAETSVPRGVADKKAARDGRRLHKSKLRAKKSGAKLEAAREKWAAQKPPKKPGPVKTLGRAARFQAWGYVHGKIHAVEHENVGVEAAHKAELAGETAVLGATRFVRGRIRTRPARRVARLERRDIKAKADLQYRTMAREHPELKKGALSRFWQKQRIKKQYQKNARAAAKQSGKAAKKTAVTTEKIARAVWGLAKRNPAGVLIAIGVLLLLLALQSCMASLTTVGNGLISVVGGTSYVSSDSDIEAVEKSYTRLEAGLRARMSRIESDYPDYDEYRYTVDEIGHDPFELASYLTAKFGEYTPDKVQEELQNLIRQQYTLTLTKTVEVRYRTETYTWTDANGNTHTSTYQVPYNYYILNVTLKNHSIGAVAAANLDAEQYERYLVYQKTRGNRPYLFEGNIYAHPGQYTHYDIPPEALSDPAFAALIREAEKYLGYPYVWGGSSPSTSFDCSGFVCYVLQHSGVYDIGRTTAQGIFNECAKIPPAEARPGDIIFFTGTYDSGDPVSHVGIYVGGGMMLHCGNPIQYAPVNTPYWTEHFYAFGRLSG